MGHPSPESFPAAAYRDRPVSSLASCMSDHFHARSGAEANMLQHTIVGAQRLATNQAVLDAHTDSDEERWHTDRGSFGSDESPSHSLDLTHLLELAIIEMNENSTL